MYTVKKLHLGKHKLDNGRMWTGFGFAVLNPQGQIVTDGANIEVYDRKFAASASVKFYNRKVGLTEVSSVGLYMMRTDGNKVQVDAELDRRNAAAARKVSHKPKKPKKWQMVDTYRETHRYAFKKGGN